MDKVTSPADTVDIKRKRNIVLSITDHENLPNAYHMKLSVPTMRV